MSKQIANSKNLLIEAEDYDDNKTFIAWEHDDKIYSLETIPFNHPTTTIYEWDNISDFIEGITWMDYICDGNMDTRLRMLLKEAGHIKEEV